MPKRMTWPTLFVCVWINWRYNLYLLKNGFNKIDIEAINQGSSGPNTAEFQVFDDKGASISANQWNLSTGFKATIVIVKE